MLQGSWALSGSRACALFGLVFLSCGSPPAPPIAANTPPAAAPGPAPLPSAALAERAEAVFGSLPAPSGAPPEVTALGRRLFFDTRFSADQKVGCVTCHLPSLWGTDGLPKSRGAFGRLNQRNAPTVFNAAFELSAHWRGDRASVEDQARRALLGPASFALESEAKAEALWSSLAPYPDAFRAAFPHDEKPISVKNFATAVGAYERTLLTPAPFDAFLSGNASALSEAARAGLQTFLDVGCARCHGGPLLGGNALRRFGISVDYASLTHSEPKDAGRFDVTHDESDRDVFKVPPLRNVEKTAPYFHDGSVAELPRAVEIMAEAQLGQRLSPAEVTSIVAFLGSLTGAVPANYAAP